MGSGTAVVAVDFGATSVRVCRVELHDQRVLLDVVHRVAHRPVADADGTTRWDWDRLVRALEVGLGRALERGPVASIGIDTWGCDYGLLDDAGRLVAPPHSYRDSRTRHYRAVVERVGARLLYEIAGVQPMAVNTIFQLAVHRRDELTKARHVLLLPELLVHHLTGAITAERTSAGTTGLVDLGTGRWSDELCAAIGLDPRVLPEIASATRLVGHHRGVPVHLVGGHDTASAVVAGAAGGEAFVSSGTWLLVGREQVAADTGEQARLSGFSNEVGALGGIRFQRNVAGWWLLEGACTAWPGASTADLVVEAAHVPRIGRLFDATDERFFAPADMAAEIHAAAGLPASASPVVVTRTIIESMAATVGAVTRTLPDVGAIRLFGGGARPGLFADLLAAHAGHPVRIGPVEAAALGNALTQGIALGLYHSLETARRTLAPPRDDR